MGDVVYRATIPLTRVKGPLRLAEMPSESEPVRFGTHGPIARHYGIQGDVPDPHATTIDYVVAATGGWLLGTLGGALEARGIAASAGHLTAVAHGEVEVDEGVLVLRRIHVVFSLNGVPAEKIDSAQRAHEAFKMKCPIYRSVHRAIDVTTELNLEPWNAGTLKRTLLQHAATGSPLRSGWNASESARDIQALGILLNRIVQFLSFGIRVVLVGGEELIRMLHRPVAIENCGREELAVARLISELRARKNENTV